MQQERIGNFTIDLKKSGTELNATIQCATYYSNAQYYFYLVKDGIVVDRKGWFVENTYQWTLQETGVYFVQGYIRIGNERDLRQSKEITYIATQIPVSMPVSDSSLPAKISIFGSCTSRDLFRLYPSKDLELCSYVARQSVVSAVSEPIPLELDDIKLESAFQKMAVWRDFNKTTFDLFKEDGSEWLIIDLIDERFPPVRYGDSYVTKSSMAIEAGLITEDTGQNIRGWRKRRYMPMNKTHPLSYTLQCIREIIRINRSGQEKLGDKQELMIAGASIRIYILRFVERLLENYRPDHIIIHRALTVDQYWDSDGKLCEFSEDEKAMGKMINEIIIYMYDLLEEYIPQAHVIDCISGYHGSEQHHWGKATVHYEDGYYAEVMERVKNFVSGKDTT